MLVYDFYIKQQKFMIFNIILAGCDTLVYVTHTDPWFATLRPLFLWY